MKLKTDNGCTCHECGKKYRIDLYVPDYVWNVIKPAGKSKGAGLLCGSCIIKKMEDLYQPLNIHGAFDLKKKPGTAPIKINIQMI